MRAGTGDQRRPHRCIVLSTGDGRTPEEAQPGLGLLPCSMFLILEVVKHEDSVTYRRRTEA